MTARRGFAGVVVLLLTCIAALPQPGTVPSRATAPAVRLAAAGAARPAAGDTRAIPPGLGTGLAAPAVELLAQTPTVAVGGVFELMVRLPEVPGDGSIELVLHSRVRSRSELAGSMEGTGLRGTVYRATSAIASLPATADGARRLALSLDPAAGVAVTTAGAYPVELIARDATGSVLATLVTHLIVRPELSDDSPPLAVAVVARVDPDPALQPDGSIDLAPRAVAAATALATALAAEPDTPATLAVRPETIDALSAGADPSHTALLDQLRVAATGRSVLSMPYVDVSPDALVDAGLTGELAQHLERGRLALANAFEVDPSTTTWLAGPDLDQAGLAALEARGVRHIVVDPAQIEPLRAGVLRLSLAQPFLLTSDRDAVVDAIAIDDTVRSRLDTPGAPGLEVSRLLAELAMLWLEQPGVPRAAVVPIDPSVRGEVVQALLAGIAEGGVFEAVELDDVFAVADPLVQPGGARVDRPLAPAEPPVRLGSTLARELAATRGMLASFTSLIGPDSPRADPVASQLLLATATALEPGQRRQHLDAARTGMETVVASVTAINSRTITLTARDGTVPLTLRNESGIPVQVVVRLRSPKLEFPDGSTIPLTLVEEVTRLDVDVRARTSGAFPLDVEITSPDGGLRLAELDYSVRSTAVSGVGLVLSAGAALFLLVWWARHWHRTRRSAKLVATHPVHAARRAGAGAGGADA